MLVSYNLINKFVDISNISPEEIANRLTFAGVEVEEFYPLSSATNLTTGKVIKCDAIEGTHLHLCQVDLGAKRGVKQIICGAPNVREGLKVIVALPGAKLPGGEIKISTIRGYESNGMLCSLLELGVNSKFVDKVDLTGIHELESDIEIGDDDILSKLGLKDIIFNLKILANRSDLYSVYNVAKEIANLFSLELKKLPYENFKGVKSDFKIDSTTSKCPIFHARVVKGLKVSESPKELKDALIASGIRPINNIVDISNYVMLLTGQPLHFYDYDKLVKKELIVKDDYEGDFIALDENNYKILQNDLVVTCNGKVMCLAGVMGGLDSSDDDNTKNIVIESAYFESSSIRRTSTRLNLISESSIRFSHGINPHFGKEVIEFATTLLKKYSGFSEISEIISYDKFDHTKKIIKTSISKINLILGTDYSYDEISKTLINDYFDVKTNDNENLTITVPDYRIDVYGENDIAEEVSRILGFSRVKNELPLLKASIGVLTKNQIAIRDIKSILRSKGLYEVFTYVLVNNVNKNLFNYLNNYEAVPIKNPMTDDHAYVRTSIVPSLLDVISYNLAHQNKDFGIFEIADINTYDKKDKYLSIALVGNELYQDEMNKIPYSFYHLKGYVEAILSSLGIEKNRYQLQEWNLAGEFMHPYRSAVLKIQNKMVGYLGEVHPSALPIFNIKNEKVYVLELNLTEILNIPTGQIKFKQISKFPGVYRDLALLVKDDIKVEKIINIVKRNSNNLIKNVSVFDVYKDKLMLDKKSVAIKLYIAKEDGTLKDAEIVETIEKLKIALLKEGINVR